MTDQPIEVAGAVAVVTGGASGIGRAIAAELLQQGATVVVADVEAPALEAAVDELAALGPVSGLRTDVSDPASVEALAADVFASHGLCNLLFLNAGVTSGGGGLPWQQEPNDWRWCFGVNVFGVANGVSAFVPRMIASGQPGQVVVTSSKDGGIAPVPMASVYAASKAAISCLAESLQHNLVAEGTAVRASVLYPSGGLLDTGLYDAARNRPPELARTSEGTGRTGMSFAELKAKVAAATGSEPPVADLAELARFTVEGAAARRFLIARDLDASAELLHRRADAIGRGDPPPLHTLASFGRRPAAATSGGTR
jgi:NAD(P)-dependent dehydrogenase (short-subunit alcohol dehydrogenase family)